MSPPESERVSVVYFIGSADGGHVKIGVTTWLDQRWAALQTASPTPLRLLATIPGGRSVERWWHQQFKANRVHGEWFRLDEALCAAIAQATYTPREALPLTTGVQPFSPWLASPAERSRVIKEGLTRARARGARLGRPRVLTYPTGMPDGTTTVREVAALWGVSKSTAHRRLRAA